jgi:hypothetical protein
MDYYVEKMNDGKYHLKSSGSPEYTRDGYPPPRNCNYNLSVIKWMAGEPCRVRTGMTGPIKAYGIRNIKLTDVGNRVTRIDLRKNESVVLYSGLLLDLEIRPVPVFDAENYWGTITSDSKQGLLAGGIQN